MKEKLKELAASAIVVGVAAAVVFGAVAITALLGGNLMALFGFRYESVGQLLLYFLLTELVDFPLDLFCQGLPKALYQVGRVDRRQANLLYVPMDALCGIFSFWLADQLMSSVSATGLSLWIIAFVMALTSLPVKKKDDQNHSA